MKSKRKLQLRQGSIKRLQGYLYGLPLNRSEYFVKQAYLLGRQLIQKGLTNQKREFSIKDFFSKWEQILSR